MDQATTFALVLSGVSALTTLAGVLFIYFSGPVATSRRISDWLDRLEGMESSWRTQQIDFNSQLDAIVSEHARAVSARNRASGLESKAKQREMRERHEQDQLVGAGSQVPATREELMARATKLGMFEN